MAKSRLSKDIVGQPTTIARAVLQIRTHPAIVGVTPLPTRRDSGDTDVQVSFRVNLPTAWLPAGQSPSGVKAIEQVVFRFSHAYPFKAPTILLRHDFNRALPHIQPGSAKEPVVPCYYEGVPDELLQQAGIVAIVNQIAVWLQKAAFDELIDPNQGWEPTRRDNIHDQLVADAEELRRWVSSRERIHIFNTPYAQTYYKTPSGLRIKTHARLQGSPATLSQKLVSTAFSSRRIDSLQLGHSFSILVCPGSLNGEPIVVSKYYPETISTLSELYDRATEIGGATKLEAIFSRLKILTINLQQNTSIPIFIILAIRRPFNLIGSASSIELLPYVTWVTAPIKIDQFSSLPVYPLAHRHAITQRLLREMSGTVQNIPERSVVQLGCGSLGSKIVLHLSRAGMSPSALIDKGSFSPHNAARHGLLPSGFQITDAVDSWIFPKSLLLAQAVSIIGKNPKVFTDDIITLLDNKNLARDLFSASAVVINSTASLAVRECLSSPSSDAIKARIIETALYGKGIVGLMTIEGASRNPNSIDLAAEAYVLMRESADLQAAVFSEESVLERQSIGQGCGSVTMIMSDAQISMLASAMAERIGSCLQSRLTDIGEIFIGHIGPDQMSTSWSRTKCSPFTIVVPDNAKEWTIRISPRAHEKITTDVVAHPTVETGGILIGRVSEAGRTITVADVLPAPSDSERSAGQFVLGIKGTTMLLDAYVTSVRGALYCVGTWHSHLYEGGASPRDYATARIIGNSQPAPSALIIKTPTSYRVILAGDLHERQ